MRLQFQRDPSWVEDRGGGAARTYYTCPGKTGNVFQLSYAESRDGRKLEPPPPLLDIATSQARKFTGAVSSTETGACAYGDFGSAVAVTDQFPRFQIWLISNGVHIITVTHICDVTPSDEELQSVAAAVASMQLVPEARPRWKFW